MSRPLRLLLATCLIGAMSAIGSGPTLAGSSGIEVTTSEDELNVDGDCSLREAVIAANTDAPVDACPGGGTAIDEIVLQPTTYTLTIAGADEDAGLTGDLDLTSPTNILAQPIDQPATIDAAGLDRAIDVGADVQVGLFSLEIRGGNAGAGEGGAIRIGSGCAPPSGLTLAGLNGLVVHSNAATIGGGIHIGTCRLAEVFGASVVGNQATVSGGGISAVGSAIVRTSNVTISGNSALVAGGGAWLDLNVASLVTSFTTIAGNAAPDGAGVWSGPLSEPPFLLDTIVAENDGPNCGGVPPSSDVLVTDDETCGVAPDSDAGIGPLTTIGGFPVHPLEAVSPAIDANADPNCASELVFDQVGNARPQDGDGDGRAWCDAGSVEADAVPAGRPGSPPSPGPTPPPAVPTLPDTAVPLSGTGAGTITAAALVLVAAATLVARLSRRSVRCVR